MTNKEIREAIARARKFAEAHPFDADACIPTPMALREGFMVVDADGQVMITSLGMRVLAEELSDGRA